MSGFSEAEISDAARRMFETLYPAAFKPWLKMLPDERRRYIEAMREALTVVRQPDRPERPLEEY